MHSRQKVKGTNFGLPHDQNELNQNKQIYRFLLLTDYIRNAQIYGIMDAPEPKQKHLLENVSIHPLKKQRVYTDDPAASVTTFLSSLRAEFFIFPPRHCRSLAWLRATLGTWLLIAAGEISGVIRNGLKGKQNSAVLFFFCFFLLSSVEFALLTHGYFQYQCRYWCNVFMGIILSILLSKFFSFFFYRYRNHKSCQIVHTGPLSIKCSKCYKCLPP